MPFVDNSDDNSEENVSGSTPLGQGGAPAQDVGQTGGDSNQAASMGSANIPSGQSVDQMQSQGTATNKKAPKASSGMFTNIQKYVNKNKPQAQKMSGAVTQDFSKQASDIRAAADKKRSEQQKLLDVNTQVADQAKGQAQSAVNQIMGTQQENPQYEAASADQFQDLMRGEVEGFQQVGDLNIAKQNMRADALSQLAKGASTEQGRRNLLGQTFQKQGDYTRGMSGLDNLITSGDRSAREGLVQGTQGTAKELGTGLQGMSQEAAQAKADQDFAMSNIGQEVTDIASGAQTGLDTDIQTAYDEELANRAALLDPESAEYQAATAAAQGRLDSLGANVGSLSDYADFLQQHARASGSHVGINDYLQKMRDFDKSGSFSIQEQVSNPKYTGGMYNSQPKYKNVTRQISGDEAQRYLDAGGGLGMSHHKDRNEIRALMNAVNSGIVGQDPDSLYGLEGAQINSGSNWSKNQNKYQAGQIMNTFRDLQRQRDELGNADDIVRRKLSGDFGNQSYDDLVSGADINKYETAGEGQIDKINALKNLMGQEDIITDEQIGDKEYASYDALKELLGKYGS